MPNKKIFHKGFSGLPEGERAVALPRFVKPSGKEKVLPQNIILIIVDALRPDHLGCYGYDKPTSPTIDKIATESIKFNNAWATSNCTMPSLVSIHTGLHPLQHGVIHVALPWQNPEFKVLEQQPIKSFPQILTNHGYKTGAIDWLDGYFMIGYSYYSSIIQDTKVYDAAENTTSAAINFIKKCNTSPFFLFIHYWDTHDPYEHGNIDTTPFKGTLQDIRVSKVRPALYKLKDHDVSIIAADYDAAIRYVDTNINRLYTFLNDTALMDNTTIIITADHGESLGEHNVWFTHHGLYDVNLHIPLLIRLPSKLHYSDTTLTLHQDLFPTILSLAGIPQDSRYHFGHNALRRGWRNHRHFHNSMEHASKRGGSTSEKTLDAVDELTKGFTGLPEKPSAISPILDRQPLIAIEAAGHDRETIRTEKWKYLGKPVPREKQHLYTGCFPDKQIELYNLKADPKELNNLATQYPNLAKDMQKRLNQEISSIKEEFTNAGTT